MLFPLHRHQGRQRMLCGPPLTRLAASWPSCASIARVRVRGLRWRAHSMCQLEPRGWFEFHHSGQIPSSSFCGQDQCHSSRISPWCQRTALCLPLTMERVSAQTCPIRCLPRAKGASETQSAQTEGKCHSVSDCKLHVWDYLANGAQTTPHSVIMACSELLCQLSCAATTSTPFGCPAKVGCVPRVSGACPAPCEDEPPQNPLFRAP